MKGHGEKITRNQEKAIAALFCYPTIKAAAKSIGIVEATLCRWLQDESFSAAYKDARHKLVGQAIGRIQSNMFKAVDVLIEISEDNEAPASARVSAARSIIDTALKSTEMEDLVKRVENLEKIIEERKP